MAATREELIDTFFAMIRGLNDTGKDILEVKKFFEKAAEVKAFTPPTIEFMTFLKEYKPMLFHEFKALLVPGSRMSLLASVDFDTGQAMISLGITSEVKLYEVIKGSRGTERK